MKKTVAGERSESLAKLEIATIVRRVAIVAMVALVASSLVGCAGGPEPEIHYYTLRLADDGDRDRDGDGDGDGDDGNTAAEDARVAGGAADGLAVGVDSFAVDPPYDQDRLVYRLGSSSAEVGFYSYHRWAAPLGRLVAVVLAEGLANTDGIASAEPSTAAGEYTARLKGRVIRLEEVDEPGRQEVRLALALTLEASDGSTLWADTLLASTSIDAESAEEVMAAAQRVLADLVARAQRAIGENLDPTDSRH